MVMTCLTKLDIKDMRVIEGMTIKEYGWRVEAYTMSRVDKEYDMHVQAWLNHQATATKQKGKKTVSAYKNFKEFFDYDKRMKAIKDTPEPEEDRRKAMLLRANS